MTTGIHASREEDGSDRIVRSEGGVSVKISDSIELGRGFAVNELAMMIETLRRQPGGFEKEFKVHR